MRDEVGRHGRVLTASFYAEPVPWVTSRRVTERIWQVTIQQPMSYLGDFTYHATAVCAAPSA